MEPDVVQVALLQWLRRTYAEIAPDADGAVIVALLSELTDVVRSALFDSPHAQHIDDETRATMIANVVRRLDTHVVAYLTRTDARSTTKH
jgi:hypothetical protein